MKTNHYTVGDSAKLPIIIGNDNTVVACTREQTYLSRQDWDSQETSWDFKRNPLI